MPELPEVETTRRCLLPTLEGRRITRVELARPRMARYNVRVDDVPERLSGRRIGHVGRVGKFLRIDVEGDLTWVMHLGMSGRIQLARPDEPRRPHTNFVAQTDEDVEVRLVDPRTFGFVAVWTPEELVTSSLARLGPDALDALPDPDELAVVFSGRTAPIKALLLDQRLVAGLGNIYADEILFRARVHPLRAAGGLTPAEVAAIHSHIGPVLEDGLAHGGTSLDDLAYLLPDGRAGGYVDRLSVYGRSGEPCSRCGTPIERVVVAQRSSHFCPTCQPV